MMIAVVAIIVIGPKDLPKALRTIGQWVNKIKGMAREFQTHVDDMVRESELDDLRKTAKSMTDLKLDAPIQTDYSPTAPASVPKPPETAPEKPELTATTPPADTTSPAETHSEPQSETAGSDNSINEVKGAKLQDTLSPNSSVGANRT